jgi:PPM family protein phosphatase
VCNFIRDLFRRNKTEDAQPPAAIDVETAPLSEKQLSSVDTAFTRMNPPQLVVGTAQSVGIQRDHNEDSLYTMSAIFADGSNDLPFGIFIIADGMGGHLNGEVASGTAARSLAEYLITHLYTPFLSGKPDANGESLHEILEKGVQHAHRSVVRNAPGGGTTLSAVVVIGDQVTFSHVGDSRIYFLYPDGRIQVVTQDHSLVKRLQDLGQIDEKEASVHPQRNVLYRALGQSEPFRSDISTHQIPHPGSILLCSDGLWGSVPDEEIYNIVQSSPNPSAACMRLVEAANAAGGPDNISAILVQYLN